MQFWLGAHHPHWLSRTDVGLFVSHRRLKDRRALPRGRGEWCLDSGGFTELNMYGRWQTPPDVYVAATRRYADEIGSLAWASPQDWMCEPWVLTKTGLTVTGHQQRTVDNYLLLRDQGPYIPVLQGWEPGDYRDHIQMYWDAGVDLRDQPLVGLGTVCRRQHTAEIEGLCADLAGIRLHGFGMKTRGLLRSADLLVSADSMAWSYAGRRNPPLPGCPHKSCANCLRWALLWRDNLLSRLDALPPRLWDAQS